MMKNARSHAAHLMEVLLIRIIHPTQNFHFQSVNMPPAVENAGDSWNCSPRAVWPERSLGLRRTLGVRGIGEWIALRVDLPAQVLEDIVGHLQKDLDHLRIKLP